jgi:proteasome lid subunit RPN8/RPN11
MTILITSELHQRLLDIAAACPDEEVCGLLYGVYNRVKGIEMTANVASSPATSFEVDPAALIAVHRAAREGGPDIIGCFHSHPNGRTSPSPFDEASSAGDGGIWLIIAAGIITGWRAVPGGFEPQPILLSE